MKFIGTKIVTAEPMNRADYCAYRGWAVPSNENPQDAGYLMRMEGAPDSVGGVTGYITWLPKEQFEGDYRACESMTFGLALEALKRGLKVARAGWNGANQWVALSRGRAELEASEFWNDHTRAFAMSNGGVATVRPYFILKTAQDDILMGWAPSQSDALAEDWNIVW